MSSKLKRQGSERQQNWNRGFPLVFGLFLGLALLKFGNPIILDSKVSAPSSFDEALSLPWPPRWSIWFLAPLAIIAICFALANKVRWSASKWLLLLPLVWIALQFISATHSIDAELTRLTLPHLIGCAACWFIGAWLLSEPRAFRAMLIGLLAVFAFCLVRAVDQRLIEFPRERQVLLEGQQTGWTNYAPELVVQMKTESIIVTTNGVDVANPLLLAKYEKGRVFGTLVYPNALAGVILLLLPLTLSLAFNGTRNFRAMTRNAAIGLTLFLGLGSLFWTGSKSGWLIALAMLGVWLFRMKWSARLKWTALAVVLVAGTLAFAVRFHNYFASGATSVGARFDYWQAAIQNTVAHPLLGSGPGTFFRVYENLKRPESEMARLTHNDYLQQFSDSGILSGLSYVSWVFLFLLTLGRRAWKTTDPLYFAAFVGLLGWFLQGFSEFSLYIPALAWTAFALAGAALGLQSNDSTPVNPASRS